MIASAVLVASSLLEGIGVVLLMPFLTLVIGGPGPVPDPTPIEVAFTWIIGSMGLPPTPGVLLWLIAAVMFGKLAVDLVARYLIAASGAAMGADQRLRLVRSLASAEWPYFVRTSGGAATTAIGTEVLRSQNAFIASCKLLTGSLRVMMILAVAMVVSRPVTLAAIAVGCLMMLLLKFLIGLTASAAQRQTELQSSLTTRLADGIASIKGVKAMGRERLLLGFLKRDIIGLQAARRTLTFVQSVTQPVVEPVTVVAVAVGVYLLVEQGSMRVEAALILALLFSRAAGAIVSIQASYQSVVASAAGYWFVEKMVSGAEQQEEHPGGDMAPRLSLSLVLDDVSFEYGVAPVLRGVHCEIPAHQLTVVVGPSGAGKTTLIDIVLGLISPSTGTVRVDGDDLREFSTRDWRARIGYVPQDPVLMHDSVRANISLGDNSVSDEQIEAAVAAAGAQEFISSMPKGLYTSVGERGSALSGGQRARIALARALVRDPLLLVLDEATASLDAETTRDIIDRLLALRSTTTILAVTHGSHMIDAADNVLEVEGSVVRKREPGHAVRTSAAT